MVRIAAFVRAASCSTPITTAQKTSSASSASRPSKASAASGAPGPFAPPKSSSVPGSWGQSTRSLGV